MDLLIAQKQSTRWNRRRKQLVTSVRSTSPQKSSASDVTDAISEQWIPYAAHNQPIPCTLPVWCRLCKWYCRSGIWPEFQAFVKSSQKPVWDAWKDSVLQCQRTHSRSQKGEICKKYAMRTPSPPSLTGKLACCHWEWEKLTFKIPIKPSLSMQSKRSTKGWSKHLVVLRICKRVGTLTQTLTMQST